MRRSVFFSFAFLLVVCRAGTAQDVVSASSGVLSYFEGNVMLDDKPLEHKAAVFPSLKNGSVFRTGKGRAELLLTPGVYLRVDENTSLHMVSNSLSDTRLDVEEGSAILDTLSATPSRLVTLIYHGSAVHFPKPGVYRMDCDLGELQVFSGEAEVTHQGKSTTVDSSHLYYFSLELTTNKFGEGSTDEFYDWAHNRSDVIADQNQRASAEQDEAQDPDPGAGGLFAAPPSFAGPGYAAPSTSIYGSSAYGNILNPYYLNPPTPFLGFLGTPGIVVITPWRHRPGRPQWPVSTAAGYGSTPVITRWPVTGQNGSYFYGTGLRPPLGSTYRPSSIIVGARPTFPVNPVGAGRIVPHVAAPHVSAPHVAAPHIGAVGHR